MAGKTDDDFAAQKKVLEEKEAEVLKLKADLEKATGRVDNAQNKIHEWEGEIGGVRKENKALTDELADAKKTVDELKEMIERHKVAPEYKKEHDDGQGASEKPEDIEKELNEDQRKSGEEKFSQLSEDERIQYRDDPSFRLAFLKRLKNDAPVVPTHPWSTAKDKPKAKSGFDEAIERVFKKKKQASSLPGGPRTSAALPGSRDKEPEKYSEDDRVN